MRQSESLRKSEISVIKEIDNSLSEEEEQKKIKNKIKKN